MYTALMRKHSVVFNVYLFQTLMWKYVNYQYYLHGDLPVCVKVSSFKVMKNHILNINNTLILIVDYLKCILFPQH